MRRRVRQRCAHGRDERRQCGCPEALCTRRAHAAGGARRRSGNGMVSEFCLRAPTDTDQPFGDGRQRARSLRRAPTQPLPYPGGLEARGRLESLGAGGVALRCARDGQMQRCSAGGVWGGAREPVCPMISCPHFRARDCARARAAVRVARVFASRAERRLNGNLRRDPGGAPSGCQHWRGKMRRVLHTPREGRGWETSRLKGVRRQGP
eukprot:364948-Chlamydomonas_euryale.AAC.19